MQHITLLFEPVSGRIHGRYITARGLHGLLFAVLRQANRAEADWLHNYHAPKPFSLAALYDQRGDLVGLRLAAMVERVRELFLSTFESLANRGDVLQLGRYQNFKIQEVACSAGFTFANFALVSAKPTMSLNFLSPTAFKQGPGHLPLPLPINVFQWPFRVWQGFAPAGMHLPDSWLDWCQQEIFVIEHQIQTATIAISQQESFTGFVGRVRFQAHDQTEDYLQIWQALGYLATFSGVGHKTTMGLGAVDYSE